LLAEAEAERQQKGLWQEPKTKFIVPWLFRSMKKTQKNLVPDPKTHDQLVKQIQKLCKKLDTGKLTDNEFTEQFKELMK
jgi:micrococcal nuclease